MYEFNFQEFLSCVDSYKKLDPFYEKASGGKTLEWLISDIKKLEETVKLKDPQELKEKLGNVLWSTFVLLGKFEDKNQIDINDVLSSTCTKIIKGKPFLLDGRKVTESEARELWIKSDH